jgi:hypothetical protein
MFEIGMHVTPLPKKTIQTDFSNVLPKSQMNKLKLMDQLQLLR